MALAASTRIVAAQHANARRQCQCTSCPTLETRRPHLRPFVFSDFDDGAGLIDDVVPEDT